MDNRDDDFSPDEAARRRDEVIRRMANTVPQHRATPVHKKATNLIFQRFGITAQMLHTAAAKVHALTQDPAAMAKVNMRAGLIKAPNANAAPNASAAAAAPTPAPMASAGGSNGAD